ncbi:MAG TPA: hypothetical protein VJT54_05930, partial [Verrucomicrobiae bacterium]|nr:hypothetical protein [Verrucomicrobiae bacterium]
MKTVTNNAVGGLKSKFKLLKSVAAACGFLLMLPGARAQFNWPVYEPFSEYTNSPLNLGADITSNYWNFGQGNGVGVTTYVITNSAALSYIA